MTKAITGDNLASAQANEFFKDINFTSIVDTIKNIYMSDGAMNTLLDYERVLDDADVYAFKNWINGELVQGPEIGRYTCSYSFMWPYKLMPDPKAALRLTAIGCNVKMMKGQLEVPVEVPPDPPLEPKPNAPPPPPPPSRSAVPECDPVFM